MIGFLGIGRHGRLRILLSSYVDGQVSESEAGYVEEHLAGCDECRLELETLRATVGLLHQLPELEVPRSFALAQAPVRVPDAPRLMWATPLGASAAAMLLVVLLVGDALGIVTQTETAMLQPVAVEKEVVKEVTVEKQVEQAPALDDGAVAEMERAVVVEREVVREVVKEVAVEEVVVLEKEVVREIPVEKAVEEAGLRAPVTEAALPPSLATQMDEATATAELDTTRAAAPVPATAEEAVASSPVPATTEGIAASPPVIETFVEIGIPSAGAAKEAREASKGLGLPLWQLEAAVGGVVALLALVTVWAWIRGTRSERRTGL